MNEKQKALMELAESNEEFKAKMEALVSEGAANVEQAIIDLAKAYGLELSEDDLKVTQKLGEEIDDDELEAVAGGTSSTVVKDSTVCECYIGGGGDAIIDDGVKYAACACILGGGGVDTPNGDGTPCFCAIGGIGYR